MKTICSLVHPLLVAAAANFLVATLLGQPQVPPDEARVADAKWAELQQKSRPGPGTIVRAENDKASTESKSRIAQQAVQAWQASLQARSFYSQFPAHPKAGEARKLEALSAVLSIREDNPDHERSALTIATLYRENSSMPAASRCEVAIAIERYLHSKRVKGKLVKDSPTEWVAIATKVRTECGDQPPLQMYLVEMARRADLAAAAVIAESVVKSNQATASVRDEARSMVARAAMVGKSVNLKLPRLEGGELELGRTQAAVTALVVWSPDHAASTEALKSIQANLPRGVQLVFVALGGDINSIRKAQPTIRVPGTFCVVGKGGPARATANVLNLRHAPVPIVYVINRDGKVAAIGRVRELPSLLAKSVG